MTAQHTFYLGNTLTVLRTLPDESVHCCVTSPPYWGLRDYGVPGQIGLEAAPEEYVAKIVEVFREVRRVLRDDGTLWLNLGDGYVDKQLRGIPWRVAFALQDDGWWLRSDIIWCLSGGTWVYARTQKGDMPMTIKDMARLDPKTVQLWNGSQWTQLLGMSRSHRQGDEIELVLRSGERVSCTPTHKFPTTQGLKEASNIGVGDILTRTNLPEPESPLDCVIDEDVAWFAGLYVAEGSRSNNCIQIAGHVKEEHRWRHVQEVAKKYGGTATRTVDGNCMNIRVYGKILNALLDELVTGKIAKDKGFSPKVWRYSNRFLDSMLQGYLDGDGHWDEKNNRWRIGFTRNYNLERDLRTACARLGYRLTLNMSSVPYNGNGVPTFRGEIRKTVSAHRNSKDTCEVVEIRKARCREVYDMGVAGEPHVFALASGILTHNSKPNPMPESVTDRPTKSHEYIFLLTKSGSAQFWTHPWKTGVRKKPEPDYVWVHKRTGLTVDYQPVSDRSLVFWTRRNLWKGHDYFYDGPAIEEPQVCPQDSTPEDLARAHNRRRQTQIDPRQDMIRSEPSMPRGRTGRNAFRGQGANRDTETGRANRDGREMRDIGAGATRNKRDVWTVATQPFPGAHFAVFPEDLVEPCILAGTSEVGCCPKCGAPWVRVVDKQTRYEGHSAQAGRTVEDLLASGKWQGNNRGRNVKMGPVVSTKTRGWQPTCSCGLETIPCTVLDPFGGSGTVSYVAQRYGRSSIYIDLNPKYRGMAIGRMQPEQPSLVQPFEIVMKEVAG